jgi:hypothetical protein
VTLVPTTSGSEAVAVAAAEAEGDADTMGQKIKAEKLKIIAEKKETALSRRVRSIILVPSQFAS